MSGKVYLKNRLPAILVNLLGMTALALFLMAGGTGLSGIVLILTVWLLVLAGYLTVSYVAQKRYLDQYVCKCEIFVNFYPDSELSDLFFSSHFSGLLLFSSSKVSYVTGTYICRTTNILIMYWNYTVHGTYLLLPFIFNLIERQIRFRSLR